MAAAAITAKRKKKVAVAPEEGFKLEDDPNQHLPPKSQRLLDDTVQKKTLAAVGTAWIDKRIVLSHDKIALCAPGSERVAEYIPLLEILEVKNLLTEYSGDMISHPSPPVKQTSNLQSLISRTQAPAVRKPEDSDKQWSTDGSLKPKMEISTVLDGHNGGRRFIVRFSTGALRDKWVTALSMEVERAVQRKAAHDRAQRKFSLQSVLRTIHDSLPFQTLFAFLILLMFLNAVAIAELGPGKTEDTLETIDIAFTFAFTLELLINMGALWFFEFWIGPEWFWNWFDFILISITLPLIFVTNSSITWLRLIRVLRIAKLFHRVESLNKIIVALTASLVPVFNAFIILFVLSCIYAILGTELYWDKNPEQFGDFSSSLFTMFQVMTGDAWSTDVARPLFDSATHPQADVSIFFVSFFVIAGIFVLNVVIAVLLDAFLEQLEADKAKERDTEQREILEATIRRGTSIDPLLLSLSSFSSMEDLNDKIHDIFKALDVSQNGLLAFEELAQGLQKLNVEPKIKFSEENFDIITENYKLCVGENKDQIDEATFREIITSRLKQFMKRYIGERMVPVCRDDMKTETILFMLKTLMLDESAQTAKIESAHRDGAPISSATSEPRLKGIEHRIGNLEGEVASISSKLDVLISAVSPKPAPKKSRSRSGLGLILGEDTDDEI